MDGDRPVVDGRDIFESKLQELLLEAWAIGTIDGENDDWSYRVQEELYPKLHELVISYLDSSTSDVGSQDEAPEEREMGDGVRSEGYLSQLMTDTPYKLDVLTDGTLIFRLWNLPQNPR